jgi:hypothetical protein
MVVASKPMKEAALNTRAMASEPDVRALQLNGSSVNGAPPPSPPLIRMAASRNSTTRNQEQ